MTAISKPSPLLQESESLLEFPCVFPIKIMGRTRDGFAQEMLDIVLRHVPDYDSKTMAMRASKEGRYISLTCMINASSKLQLDGLYRELSSHPDVVMVL